MCKPCIAKARAAAAANASAQSVKVEALSSPIASVKAVAPQSVGRPRVHPQVTNSSTQKRK